MARRPPPFASNDIVELTIDRLAQGGKGVARHDGFVVFVARGMPGDRIKARITRVRRSFAEAVVFEQLKRGETSVDAPCPYHAKCGGCAWQGLSYEAQLEAKESHIRDSLERIAGIAEPKLAPIIAADNQFGYRNKMEYTFTEIVRGGQPEIDTEFVDPNFAPMPETDAALGFHEYGRWDSIVPIDACLIADPRGRPALNTVVAWANRYNIPVHDRETGDGFLRHLVVRVGHATGEVLVNLVTGPGEIIREAELLDDLEADVPGLVSIFHSETASSAEVAMGDAPPKLLWGREWFEEEMGGIRLRVRPNSFLQTNTEMANKLYAKILEVGEIRADDVAWDLYCGIGSITMLLAQNCETVIGAEVVPEAIVCAHENAELNGISNVEFHVGNVRPLLKFAAYGETKWPDPTVIVFDPPRSGLVKKVIMRACERKPERMVYVSCNPATFAGDLPVFAEHGYEVVSVQPLDQFPHTHHAELVARLEPIASRQ